MRLSSILIRVATFGAAALVAYVGSSTSVSLLEKRSGMAVQEALIDANMPWSRVIADGLQIVIEGEAPTEIARLRAVTVAGGVVDASRVINNASVKDTSRAVAPDFTIEMLRNESGVSLIGLIPADTDRESLTDDLQDMAEGDPVTDLLETADYPVPSSWRASMHFGVRAMDILPRSKISVSAGLVQITASSDSPEQRAELERRIRAMKPEGVAMQLNITAPRPVVSPFITRFILDTNGARFEACTADTAEAQDMILQAAANAGFEGRSGCTLGLGSPSRQWGTVVSQSIDALKSLGGGTLTVSDADVTIEALIDTPQDTFDEVVGRLENRLPEVFALSATLPEPEVESETGPPQFIAALTDDDGVTLTGRLPNDLTTTLVENFAQARFPGSEVEMGTLTDENLPTDWQVRILAGLEALSRLKEGSLTVEPDSIVVSGSTGNEEASADISGLLVNKLGPEADFSINVEYLPELDLVVAGPTPEQCVSQINVVTANRKITFDPGSATLTAEAGATMNDISEILSQCIDLSIEIAGYTDSQGREEMNLALSQERAEAVLSALRARRVPTSSFNAVGYGEADPIADNDTEEGREANRRIEFRLVTEEEETEATDEGEATAEEGADATAEETPAEPEAAAE